MSNIVEFKKEDVDNKVIRVTKKDGEVTLIEAEYFGIMEHCLDFIGFWKSNYDHPHIMIDGKQICSIEILENDDDNR